MRNSALDAITHQGVPFERLVETLNPPRSLARNPLFQVMLHFRDQEQWSDLAGDTTLTMLPVDFDISFLDINVSFAIESDGSIAARLVVSKDLYEPATAELMADVLAAVFEAFAAAPDGTVDELDILSPAERARVLETWANGTDPVDDDVEAACTATDPAELAKRVESEGPSVVAADAAVLELGHAAGVEAVGVGLVGVDVHHDGTVAGQRLGIGADERRDVIRRTDRGVFSVRVQESLLGDNRIHHLQGRVVRAQEQGDMIALTLHNEFRPEQTHTFDLVVDATGGQPLWFLELFDASAVDQLELAVGWPVNQERLESSIGFDLSVTGLTPKLFLPNLAGMAQGPGFPNLSCLGALSDRVLAPQRQRRGTGRVGTAGARRQHE